MEIKFTKCYWHSPESLRSQAYQLLCDGESNTNHYLLWEPTCNCCRHEPKGNHLHIQAEYKSNSSTRDFLFLKLKDQGKDLIPSIMIH